ncbi:hypothetical protein BU15DRAFT_82155 [Melanogaster broomeanus]|nr:hypothetical protein BU15DRAFT_82155 [Melanogaster broomeanus]
MVHLEEYTSPSTVFIMESGPPAMLLVWNLREWRSLLPAVTGDQQDDEILRIVTGYALSYGGQHSAELEPDTLLPLNSIDITGVPANSTSREDELSFIPHLHETALHVVARSLFVANSGHDDRISTALRISRVPLVHTSFPPSFTAPTDWSACTFALNAYILHFYPHGQVTPLSVANANRSGDIWFTLRNFDLMLMTVRGAPEQSIMRKKEGAVGRYSAWGKSTWTADSSNVT